MERAAREGLVILTEDRDFTTSVREAAQAGTALPVALVHYRLDGLGRATKMARMVDAIAEIDFSLPGMVHVVEPGRVRTGTIR